ncbi:hypothetical protein [Chryseobacterium lactis]|uniref:hypothetical protein n=1 Tax=Chryseobacterium lactis TaxID=1241981 RepID=UPI001627078F|nr:hypothetical protein [Chryseobacterium lactis]
MKKLFYLILILGLISCKKEPTFADLIVFHYEKKEKLSFQHFNEGLGETGTGIMYIGKDTSQVNVKYFQTMLAPPPPPPFFKIQQDSVRDHILSKYFYPFPGRVIFSYKNIIYDSLGSDNVKIVVKIQDTIPKYAYNFETGILKKYKSFPVFIKNISGRKLILPQFKNLFPALLNDKKKWQLIKNDNGLVCADPSWNHVYWEFGPDEIIVTSVNFLPGKDRGKFKLSFGSATSEPFMMNYDKKIIQDQDRYLEIQ